MNCFSEANLGVAMPPDYIYILKLCLKLCLKLRVQNCEKWPVKDFKATEQGLNVFGDVSGRFSNFSFYFLFHFSFWS